MVCVHTGLQLSGRGFLCRRDSVSEDDGKNVVNFTFSSMVSLGAATADTEFGHDLRVCLHMGLCSVLSVRVSVLHVHDAVCVVLDRSP